LWWSSLLVLLLAVRAEAVVRFVNGACTHNGNGTAATCAASAGAAGAYNTIGNGVTAMSAATGDHLNIRGPHTCTANCAVTSFDGVYFEAISLRSGIALPGQTLNCPAGNPCVIQGCRVADGCAADEVPIVRGMRLRSDWTVASGSGSSTIYTRAMEALPVAESSNVRDSFDPGMLLEGTQYPLTMMPYQGDNSSAPVDGRWSYNTSTNAIFVNPSGSGDPSTTIYVPHFSWNFWFNNPSNNVTVRHMVWEGSRLRSLLCSGTGSQPASGLRLEFITRRYVRRFFNHSANCPGFVDEDGTVEYGGRGASWFLGTGDGVYGWRMFGVHGGAIRRCTVRALGSDGTTRLAGGAQRACPWAPAPWNTQTGTAIAASADGVQIKQTEGFTVEDCVAEDLCGPAYVVDVTHNITIQRNRADQVRSGITIGNQTPVAGFNYSGGVLVQANVLDRVGHDGANSCAMQLTGGNETDGTVSFLARFFNNMVSRIGFAGLCLDTDGTPTTNVTVAHNTFTMSRSVSGAIPPRAIAVRGAVSNVVLRNNVAEGLTGGMLLSSAACGAGASACLGLTLDGDVMHNISGCEVDWNAPVWGTGNGVDPAMGTCSSMFSFSVAKPPNYFTSTVGPLNFVNPSLSPPNLHLGSGSAAINAGVNFPTVGSDIDGESRPQSSLWDPGADEVTGTPPTTATTTTSTTTSTTTTSTLVGATTTTSTTTTSTTTTSTTTSTTSSTTFPPGGAIEKQGPVLQGVEF
jgi:hypothetical protein